MATELEGIITVDHEELDGSPTESYDDQGFKAVRVLQCAWADRLTLAEELRGGNRYVGDQYVYTRPQRYPHYEQATVADVSIAPFGATQAGADTTQASYPYARLTVTYRVPDYGSNPAEEIEETLVTESLEPAAEFLTLPHEGYFWKDGADWVPLTETEAPQKLLRMLEWVYTRHQQTHLPSAVLDLVGKVNDSTVTSTTLGLSFPAGTLLYNPPQLEREITTTGAKAWRVTYRFTYRPSGWNKFPRRKKDGKDTSFETIYKSQDAGDPLVVYESGSFSQVMA